MNLASVIDEIGDRLATIDGLRVYKYPTDNVQTPAAFIDFPETYTYDETYGRGMDRLSLPIVLVVSRTVDRTSIDRLGAYVNGDGAQSVKAVIEADDDEYTAFDTIRVVDVEFSPIQVAAVIYYGAILSVDIAGTGAS